MEISADLEKQFSSENLIRFRNAHSIKTPEKISVSPENIHMESGAGNFVVIPENDSRVIRVVQYKGSDSKMRIDSPTIIAILQEIDPKAKFYFPIISGFAKADISHMQSTEDPSVVLKPHVDDKYDEITTVPTSIVERISDEKGWSIQFIRAISRKGGMSAVISKDFDNIQGDELRMDAENSIRIMFHLMQAEKVLAQHDRYLADFKGSFAVHVGEEGKIDQIKIMDMDEVRYQPDKEARDKGIKNQLRSIGVLPNRSTTLIQNLKLNPDNADLNSVAFKMLLKLDLFFKQSVLSKDLIHKFGIQYLSIEKLSEIAESMIAAIGRDNAESDPSLLITPQEYIDAIEKIDKAEEAQFFQERRDGSTGVVASSGHGGWDKLLIDGYGIDSTIAKQVGGKIALSDNGSAGKLLVKVDNDILREIGQLLIDFDGENSRDYYGAIPEVEKGPEGLWSDARLIQDLFLVACPENVANDKNKANVKQFIANLRSRGVTKIPIFLEKFLQ